MKSSILGLAILGIAMATSAFTNVKIDKGLTKTYYVTSQASINSPNDAYAFEEDEINCPGSGAYVCKFTTGSTLTSPQLKTIVEAQSDIERRDLF
jgi:hypothetical protein